MNYLPFGVGENKEALKFGEEPKYTAKEIFVQILIKLKEITQKYLGKEAINTVITILIYIYNDQREEIKEFAYEAGLHYVRLIQVTIASAFSSGLDKTFKENKNLLIFDLGGGFLDIAIISVEEGLYEALSVEGNDKLGGKYFDLKIAEYCLEEFRRITNMDIKTDKKALVRLLKACEKSKKILTNQNKVNIQIDNLMEGKGLNLVLTREKFEELCLDLFKKCISHIENCIKGSKLSKEKIDEIVLMGGSSRIPKIRQMIQEFFEGKEINITSNPELSPVFGASIKGAIISNVKDKVIEKIANYDACSFSYGVETAGGVMSVLIKKNTYTNSKKTSIFSTYNDYQQSALIRLYEGERQLVKDNHLIKEIKIDNITYLPRMQPYLEITLDVDDNNLATLHVVDKTEKLQK